MAHPSREKFFPDLKRLLGNEVPFAIDHKSAGVWPNCRQAWMLYDPTAEYHVVIQDDAIVCEGFMGRALKVIEQSGGDKAISFYFGRRGNQTEQAARDLKRGFSLRVAPTWGVAICLRTEWIQEMLEFAGKLSNPQDDYRIGAFLRHKKIMTYFPMPSLVDHRKHEKSLVGDPGQGRCAYSFIDCYENQRRN